MVAFLLLSSASIAGADEMKPVTRISQELTDLVAPPSAAAARSAAGAPGSFSTSPPVVVGDRVTIDADDAAAAAAGKSPGSFSASPPVVVGDWVTIDAVAAGDPSDLEAELIALGAANTAIAGRLVSARIPIAAIPSLEGVAPLRFARQAVSKTNIGEVSSQGDHAMGADVARSTFGLDGSGVTVGVLSDSFDCQGGAGSDMGSGDLPPTVAEPVAEVCPGSDEGRAMLQIVHDVAPGANLAFATSMGGQAAFAANIRALRDAGAKVMVDDMIYLAEPMFQDGVIAQAVDDVAASGVSYFSAAGNEGRFGYDHAFVPGQFISGAGIAHNFGGTILQRISGPSGSQFRIVLQWDSPFFSVSGPPGTPTDLDIYLLGSDGAGGFVVVAAAANNNIGGDPVEILGPITCSNPQCVGFIMIVQFSGPTPGRIKYVIFPSGGNPSLSPAINSGTIYGHANAEGAIAVGAANYKTSTTLETFSSRGTTPVLFDTAGNLLSQPDLRQFKPEIVAPDGVDTTFLGFDNGDASSFPNLFGTSAAAPHAAGVAALVLQAVPSMTPTDVRETLRDTAQNMGPAGFDTDTGFGLIRADAALNALHVFGITAVPTGTPNPVNPGGTVSVSVAADDNFDHTLIYAWTSTCTGGLPSGSFDDASLAGGHVDGAAQRDGPVENLRAQGHGERRPRIQQDRHSHGHGSVGANDHVDDPRRGGSQRDGRDQGHEPGWHCCRDLQRVGHRVADVGERHERHGHRAAGGADRSVDRRDAGGGGCQRQHLQGGAEDHRLHSGDRGRGERDGHRGDGNESTGATGMPTVKVGTFVVPPGSITEHANGARSSRCPSGQRRGRSA